MMRQSLMFATCALLASAAIGSPDPQAPAPAAHNGWDPNERICEKMYETGSRLATHVVCATRAEWERRKLEDRQAVERLQMSPCVVVGVSNRKGRCG